MEIDNKKLYIMYNCINVMAWAQIRLKICGDMAEDRNIDPSITKQIRKIEDGLNNALSKIE